MSRMSDLYIEITEMLKDGRSCNEVSEELDCPLSWVQDVMIDVKHDMDEAMWMVLEEELLQSLRQ